MTSVSPRRSGTRPVGAQLFAQGGRGRGRGHVWGAWVPAVSGKAGEPAWGWGLLGGGAREEGAGRRCHAGPGPRRGTEPLTPRRAVRAASPASSRAHGALRRFAHRAAQTAVRRARGRGPGVQRGPRRGPAPRPGRMRPWAARELSRAPAPSPAGPGLQSRSRRPDPERHDFQAAFRLDSLQVRGRRPPPSPQLEGAARRTKLQRGGREAAGSRAPGRGRPPPQTRGARLSGDTGPGRRALVPSPSVPTLGARIGGARSSYRNLEGPSGLKPTCPASPLICPGCWKGPVLWACVGLVGSGSAMCPAAGEGVHTARSPLLGPAHRSQARIV